VRSCKAQEDAVSRNKRHAVSNRGIAVRALRDRARLRANEKRAHRRVLPSASGVRPPGYRPRSLAETGIPSQPEIQDDESLTAAFLRGIRSDRIGAARAEIARLAGKRRDVAYRVLHSSWKMHHMRDVAFLALEVTSQKVVAERWRAGWSLAVGAGPGSAHGVVAITNGAAVKTRALRRGMRADDGMRDRRRS
jgi:hypothetical protein